MVQVFYSFLKNAVKAAQKKPTKATKTAGKKASKKASSKPAAQKKWSAKVTKTSDASDVKADTFKSKNPTSIAKSLKKAAEKSTKKKASPFKSAMSMLNFYINRAGENLTDLQKKKFNKVKKNLRLVLGKNKEKSVKSSSKKNSVKKDK
ncbi:MAG: DUF3175 domain-containing protein, partial [Cytophagales bacterium]|nr:DUF3175 domain-containing protein [Cytophaga sp.]